MNDTNRIKGVQNMKKYLLTLSTILITGSLILSGCGKETRQTIESNDDSHTAAAGEMHHSESGELPEGLREKTTPPSQ